MVALLCSSLVGLQFQIHWLICNLFLMNRSIFTRCDHPRSHFLEFLVRSNGFLAYGDSFVILVLYEIHVSYSSLQISSNVVTPSIVINVVNE